MLPIEFFWLAVGCLLILVITSSAETRLRHLTSPEIVSRRYSALITKAQWSLPVIAYYFSGISLAIVVVCGQGMMKSWRTRKRKEQEHSLWIAQLLVTLDVLLAELHAGAHPAAACSSAAKIHSASSDINKFFATLAHGATLGGVVAGGINTSAQLPSVARELSFTKNQTQVVERILTAWEYAEVYGLAIAEVLSAVRNDLLARRRFNREVVASLAGARATAAVLAGLPLVGVGLGTLMGAQPIKILLAGGAGGILLVLGVGLDFAGLLWARKITEKVVVQ